MPDVSGLALFDSSVIDLIGVPAINLGPPFRTLQAENEGRVAGMPY
ncbi:hypothetical protein P3T20_002285 [Paraburkholderia sp. GAS206C]